MANHYDPAPEETSITQAFPVNLEKGEFTCEGGKIWMALETAVYKVGFTNAADGALIGELRSCHHVDVHYRVY